MARTLGSVAEETRQRIIDVARALFAERGYAGTSVRDIAERLGMTKGSMYYHFASKDELLHALVAPLADELDAFIAEAGAAGRVGEDLIGRLVDLFDEQSEVLRQLLGDPSAARGLERGQQLAIRIPALALALAGRDGSSALLRGRCALGVIHAGVLAARGTAAQPGTGGHAGPGRLGAADRRYLVRAALAVLAAPAD